jgi:hypothetical protein
LGHLLQWSPHWGLEFVLLPTVLLPQPVHLKGVIGARWDAGWAFFSDEAQTEPVPLEGYTAITVLIDGFDPLTDGAGLTVDADAGTVTATLTGEQTATVQQDSISYRLSWVEPDGTSIDFPVNGAIRWITP